MFLTRPAYRDAFIYRSTLILASVHVILWVGFKAVISQWALDFWEIFLKEQIIFRESTTAKLKNLLE